MKRTATQAPPAQTILNAYPPAPARVSLAYRPLPGRLLRTVLALLLCWGPLPWAVFVPPHYLWLALGLCGGAYLAHRSWTGRYVVRSFTGVCPRCGRHLRIDAGTTIDLPHTLTCFGCHFEPRLEVSFRPEPFRTPEGKRVWVRHLDPDCTGFWTLHWFWDDPYLSCEDCGARHYATLEARRVAEEENARGALLERLAEEGRYLTD